MLLEGASQLGFLKKRDLQCARGSKQAILSIETAADNHRVYNNLLAMNAESGPYIAYYP